MTQRVGRLTGFSGQARTWVLEYFGGKKLDFSTSGKGEKGERGADVKFCPCPFELQMLKKKKEQEEKIKQQKEEEEESRLKVSP